MSFSRIGKRPVAVPAGSQVAIGADGATVTVKGPKGQLSSTLPLVKATVQGAEVRLEPTGDTPQHKACHGLSRALLQNMVVGVSTGHKRGLVITGTGYKAELAGQTLTLSLGFSHPVVFDVPKTIKVAVENKGTEVQLECADKELLGQVAAKLRSFRPPEPYKGKGVRYADEVIRRKAGKAGKK